MPVNGLHHYNLRADRATLDVLRDFYTAVLGLQQGERPPFNNFGYWLYAGGHPVLHLSEAAPGEQRPGQVVNTFDHVAFACTDLAAVEAHLRACEIRYTSAQVPQTSVTQLFFADPAGNGVELQFPAIDTTE